MSTIAQLRKQLQGPRRSVDTWYGKNVMRRLSIYLTWGFSQLNLSPNTATTLSLVAALLGGYFLAQAQWGLGVLFMNLWYLLDHVDGELARLYKRSSASGLFYDTVINFIAQPLTFIGLGWGLAYGTGPFLLFGLAGAFGYLMLNLIPMCEASILLEHVQARGSVPHTRHGRDSAAVSFARHLFSAQHNAVTFPNFLMVLTAVVVATIPFPVERYTFLEWLLVYYSLACTVIWATQLFHKVTSKKLDRHPILTGGER